MENMMQSPSLTPYDIEAERLMARRLAERCDMVLNLNDHAQQGIKQIESQHQQIDALAKQVEELTRTNAAQAAQIETMNEELIKLRLPGAPEPSQPEQI